MLCYSCEKIGSCSTYKTLYAMSKDFDIKDCKDYDRASAYKYKLIAQNNDLMRLIYDYFTDNLDLPDVDDEEVRRVITQTLLNM